MSNLGLDAQSVAPVGTKRIGVYDAGGNRLGTVPLGRLAPPDRKKRLYSFAVLADPHYGTNDSSGEIDTKITTKFQVAMEALGKSDVSHIFLAGDVIDGDSHDNADVWASCSEIIQTCGKTVCAIPGNHERYARYASVPDYVKSFFLGEKTYGTVNIGDDLFILLGCHSYNKERDCQVYAKEELEKIYEIFRLNKGKRCFVIQHIDMTEKHVRYNLEDIQQGYYLPYELLGHYRNVVEFHGHTHLGTGYSDALGFPSFNVPPLRNWAEGIIVDVYKDGVHVRGMKVIADKPIRESYWLDTTFTPVSADYDTTK